MKPRAIAIEAINNYHLLVTFSNNEKRVFDVNPYFGYPIFASLKNDNMFSSVHVEGLSVLWSNGADICPDELYYDSKAL